MLKKEIRDLIRKYVHPFRITEGKGFQLKDFDPADTRDVKMEKSEATELLGEATAWLAEQQDILYAQDRWSLLLIFQAMDAAGKDSTIKHVMSGINPQGCQVFSFKQPSSEGPRPRFPVALLQMPSRTWSHRHFQPLILRGGARRARAPGNPSEREASQGQCRQRKSGMSGSPTSRILRTISRGRAR